MIFDSFNVYLGLAVNGFFTGFGAIMAGIVAELWIKPNFKRFRKK